MARTWLQIRVDLLSGRGIELDPPPGRVLLVGPSHAGPASEDHAAVKIAQAVAPGDEFSFTFDLGDVWEHRCRVLADKIDLREEYGPGPAPKHPVAIWGWGSIPDQYGRESADELELDD